MDNEKFIKLRELLDDLLGDNEPSDEELDFDEEAIEMYACAHNLRDAIKTYYKD